MPQWRTLPGAAKEASRSSLKTEESNLAAVVRHVTGLRSPGGILRKSARSRCGSENFLPTVAVLRETGPVSAGRYSPWK